MRSKTTQCYFLHYSDCRFSDIPRIESQLYRNGKKILLLIAKNKED